MWQVRIEYSRKISAHDLFNEKDSYDIVNYNK